MHTRDFLTLLAFILLPMSPLPGQDTSTEQQANTRAVERLEELKKRLALSPEQIEQVRPILVEEVQRLKAVRDKYSGNESRRGRIKMARELRGIQNHTDDQLRKILSRKQMTELKKIREERREELRERLGR